MDKIRKTTGPEVLYPELSYLVMEAIFEVHNQLGPGFSEEIYQKALMAEMQLRNLPFEAQKIITVKYKNNPLGTYRLDLVIDGKIILELKAVVSLNDLFKQQVISYLKASGLRLGILVNFGKTRVETIRFVH